MGLQTIIGGNIRHKARNNAYDLVITNLKELETIIFLIGGYLRTPKIYRMNLLIQWLNNNRDYSIPLCVLDTSFIGGNAWLAGFFDADGSFNITVQDKKDGYSKNRVEVRARIEQRKTDPKTEESYHLVLEAIANFLKVVLNISVHNAGTGYYIISTTSPRKLTILVNYFDKYPLLRSIRMNYLDFRACYKMMLNKEHLTQEGHEKSF